MISLWVESRARIEPNLGLSFVDFDTIASLSRNEKKNGKLSSGKSYEIVMLAS